MWILVIAVLLLSSAPAHGQSSGKQPSPHNYGFINGRWFDGREFTSKTFYSVGGFLSSRRPQKIDSIIDLKGKYVVPPFGEAHNHNVEWANVDAVIRRYLEAGIFYVKNPNSLPRTMQPDVVRGDGCNKLPKSQNRTIEGRVRSEFPGLGWEPG
jgi:hypothetical protein